MRRVATTLLKEEAVDEPIEDELVEKAEKAE